MTNYIKISDTDIGFVEEREEIVGFTIYAYDAQGREYILLKEDGTFRTFPDALIARRQEARVKSLGVIDADLWTCRAPYGTEAWLIDGEEERQIEDERMGW